MVNASIEALIDPSFVEDLSSLSLDEVRRRRGLCQSAEEALSFRRRLVQGRLDIVQAELYRRAGKGTEEEVASLVSALPEILVDHGDRHLGPGRLTSIDTLAVSFGEDFADFEETLDRIVDGARLTRLSAEDETYVRSAADRLDELEKSMSENRHRLHKHIDKFQEEIVRRYKVGDASVDQLLRPT